jgi:hypothetical protein
MASSLPSPPVTVNGPDFMKDFPSSACPVLQTDISLPHESVTNRTMRHISRTSRFFTVKEDLNAPSPDGLHPMVGNISRPADRFSGHVAKISGHVGKVSGYVAKVSGYVGKVSGYVGKISGHVGKISGYVGKISGNVITSGFIPYSSGK